MTILEHILYVSLYLLGVFLVAYIIHKVGGNMPELKRLRLFKK